MSHRITRTKSAGASCRHGSRCNYDWADIIREYSGSSPSILAKQIKQIKATRSRKASWYLSKPQAIVSLGFSHSNAPSLTKNPLANATISCHLKIKTLQLDPSTSSTTPCFSLETCGAMQAREFNPLTLPKPGNFAEKETYCWEGEQVHTVHAVQTHYAWPSA